jgi:Co/Zn/Cd efflux system component
MDCPSEEGMIRMALDSVEPKVVLEFDTPKRKVRVFHGDNADAIEERMRALGLGATLESTMPVARDDLARAQASAKQEAQTEAGILKWLLAINGIMFVIEITVGWWAQSTGLIADSLDMFADAAVYGVALYAVGHSVRVKLRAAHFSGWLQIILALGALGEVVRRLVFGSEPVSTLMMSFGLVALAANVTCLLLIARSRDSGAHMKASWIFSANDVIANLGVILAGGLVAWTGSRYPDLVIGLIIGLIVLNGARRILQLKS